MLSLFATGFVCKLARGEIAARSAGGALPENANYAVRSGFLLGFLESTPVVSAETKERRFENVVKSAERAAVLVLVY